MMEMVPEFIGTLVEILVTPVAADYFFLFIGEIVGTHLLESFEVYK